MTETETPITVCHISPLRSTRGGVSSVVNNYVKTTDWQVTTCHIESHSDGTQLQKFRRMVWAFAQSLSLSLGLSPASRRIDVMHAHVGDFPSIYRKMLVTWPFFAFSRSRRILHMHGAAILSEYDRQPRLARWLVRRFIGRFDLVIALSDRWRTDLVARFEMARIMVLPNAVAVPAIPPPRDASVPRVFLFLGLIGARKGVFDLVKATRDLAGRGATFTVRIGGNGDGAKLQAAIEACDLTRIVTHLGWIEGAVRDSVIRTSHVLVLPSYAEGAPMAVIEAMASGMPIIATRVGAIPELVEHGGNGLLIEPGDIAALTDAMATLTRDDALWARMSARSHAIACERLSLASHKTALLGAYRSLAAGVRHGR